MASLFDADLHDVREGFLCPVCQLDQGSSSQLQLHYEIAHLNEASNPSAGVSLKDLLDKAKRKILKKEIGDDSSDEFSYQPRSDFVMVYHQEVGASNRHTDYFKSMRNSRTDRYVIETNKLLHRLDKLLTEVPSDPNKRKAHEKSVVMWAANEDVPRCPNCTKAFSLTKRKHHCRLCGGIMCAQCSEFITYAYARLLTNPGEPSADGEPISVVTSNSQNPMSSFTFQRSGSAASLNSLLNSNNEFLIRVCPLCKESLDRWNDQMEQQNLRPDIVVLYEKLKTSMDDASKLQRTYFTMVDSLINGETNYSLKQAQDVKVRLTKLADTINFLGKKVLVLGIKDGDVKPHSSAIQLQRAIYLTSSNFLSDKLLGLPTLPSEEEVEKFREQRLCQIQERIDKEKKAALELQKRNEYLNLASLSQKDQFVSTSFKTGEKNVVFSEMGWTPQTNVTDVVKVVDNEDPIVQQISIIQNYIQQAKKAQKFEEVSMLEANLRELWNEYYKQKDPYFDNR